MADTCATCICFEPVAEVCRRYPPSQESITVEGAEGWPRVDADDWCREFTTGAPTVNNTYGHASIPLAGVGILCGAVANTYGPWTPVDFSVIEADSVAGLITTGVDWHYTVPVTGHYFADVHITIADPPAGQIPLYWTMRLMKKDVAGQAFNIELSRWYGNLPHSNATPHAEWTMDATGLVYLQAGDAVQFQMQVNATTVDPDTVAVAGNAAGTLSRFGIYML